MRKLLLFVTIFMVLATLGASAQKKTFRERAVSPGVRFGMNVHRLSFSGDQKWSYNTTVGFHAGIVVDLRLYKNLYFQPGVMFSTRGGQDKASAEEQVYLTGSYTPVTLHLTQTRKITAYYVEVPLLVHYKFPISPSSRISIEAGPYLAFGVGGETKIQQDASIRGQSESQDRILDTFYSDEKNNRQETFGMKRFDVGMHFGGGFHIHHFYVGVNYGLGLVNAADKRTWMEDDISLKNSKFSITAGYNF